MSDSLKSIHKLIKEGNRREAIQQLKPIINDNPSADAWYLMALALNDDADKIKALKRGLKLDALHTPSNRLLAKLEKFGDRPQTSPAKPVELSPEHDQIRQERFQQQQDQTRSRRRRRRFGCLFMLINGIIISVLLLSLAGMLPGAIALAVRITSGVEPVTEINNVPIGDTRDSFYQIEPVFSKPVQDQDFAFVDHGYLNEHKFNLSQDDIQVIFVQFLSLVANNVPQNIVILDPDGNNAMDQCVFQPISQDFDNGGAWVCIVYASGEWSLRLLGVEGETVGGYVIGNRSTDDLQQQQP